MTSDPDKDTFRYLRGEMDEVERAEFTARLAANPELALETRMFASFGRVVARHRSNTAEHPFEHQLADFVCAPETLVEEDPGVAAVVAHHIRSCNACRGAVVDMRTNLAELERGESRAPRQRVWLRPRFGLLHAAAIVVVLIGAMLWDHWLWPRSDEVGERVDIAMTADVVMLLQNYQNDKGRSAYVLAELQQRLSSTLGRTVKLSDLAFTGGDPSLLGTTPLVRGTAGRVDFIRVTIYPDGLAVFRLAER